ncbi:HK97 gp10 family phage protein [Granulicatella balaenopterae]|nr:HK97 gp10 family phage protein [Granulicatella balaenopterae]
MVAKKFAKDVAKRTPHDTGDLQKNWKYRVFKARADEYIILVWNPMEYAEYVENGHRIMRNGKKIGWVEGRFMMKTTYDEIEKLMPNVAANIERKLRKVLDE